MNRHCTDQIERKARVLYRRSCQNLPSQTRQILQQARLDAVTARPRGLANGMLMPVGALAASGLALAIGWGYFLPSQHAPSQATHYTATNAASAVRGTDNTEFYQDLDFYRWLAAQTEQPPARN